MSIEVEQDALGAIFTSEMQLFDMETLVWNCSASLGGEFKIE